MFISLWLIIFCSSFITLLTIILFILLVTHPYARVYKNQMIHLSYIIKALLLTLKQKEMFIPICYLAQVEDYNLSLAAHRDGVYIYLKDN